MPAAIVPYALVDFKEVLDAMDRVAGYAAVLSRELELRCHEASEERQAAKALLDDSRAQNQNNGNCLPLPVALSRPTRPLPPPSF